MCPFTALCTDGFYSRMNRRISSCKVISGAGLLTYCIAIRSYVRQFRLSIIVPTLCFLLNRLHTHSNWGTEYFVMLIFGA